MIANIYNIMANDVGAKLDNLQLAQLNDLAFKAIRKTGLSKKLDERTIRNESFFKDLEAKLNRVFDSINFDKLDGKDEVAAICNDIGTCPIAQGNVLELMKEKDVMCVGL